MKITLADLQNMADKILAGNIERLASIFDEIDKTISEQIRQRGLPHHIFVHPDLYLFFSEYLSSYSKVIGSGLMKDNSFVLSWAKMDWVHDDHSDSAHSLTSETCDFPEHNDEIKTRGMCCICGSKTPRA